MKSKRIRFPWAATWAWISATFWMGLPVLLMWLFIPRPDPYIYVLWAFLGLNLLMFYCFSWLVADPRGGWRLYWQRERREGNGNIATAVFVFFLSLLWAIQGVRFAKMAVSNRQELTERLNREDRWRQIHPRSHVQ